MNKPIYITKISLVNIDKYNTLYENATYEKFTDYEYIIKNMPASHYELDLDENINDFFDVFEENVYTNIFLSEDNINYTHILEFPLWEYIIENGNPSVKDIYTLFSSNILNNIKEVDFNKYIELSKKFIDLVFKKNNKYNTINLLDIFSNCYTIKNYIINNYLYSIKYDINKIKLHSSYNPHRSENIDEFIKFYIFIETLPNENFDRSEIEISRNLFSRKTIYQLTENDYCNTDIIRRIDKNNLLCKYELHKLIKIFLLSDIHLNFDISYGLKYDMSKLTKFIDDYNDYIDDDDIINAISAIYKHSILNFFSRKKSESSENDQKKLYDFALFLRSKLKNKNIRYKSVPTNGCVLLYIFHLDSIKNRKEICKFVDQDMARFGITIDYSISSVENLNIMHDKIFDICMKYIKYNGFDKFLMIFSATNNHTIVNFLRRFKNIDFDNKSEFLSILKEKPYIIDKMARIINASEINYLLS